eukprot:5269533-Prorocentrum_lima.AAC.1
MGLPPPPLRSRITHYFVPPAGPSGLVASGPVIEEVHDPTLASETQGHFATQSNRDVHFLRGGDVRACGQGLGGDAPTVLGALPQPAPQHPKPLSRHQLLPLRQPPE